MDGILALKIGAAGLACGAVAVYLLKDYLYDNDINALRLKPER